MEWQKKDIITQFEPHVVKKISQIGGQILCHTKTPLFYEGHIPIVAYLLKKGRVEVGLGKKTLLNLKPGEVLGLNEFHHKLPSIFWAMALKGSELIYIDKSTLNEFMNDGPEPIQETLYSILEEQKY